MAATPFLLVNPWRCDQVKTPLRVLKMLKRAEQPAAQESSAHSYCRYPGPRSTRPASAGVR